MLPILLDSGSGVGLSSRRIARRSGDDGPVARVTVIRLRMPLPGPPGPGARRRMQRAPRSDGLRLSVLLSLLRQFESFRTSQPIVPGS
eukprot:90100-Hanusia_phi.AAC.1